MVNCSLYKHFNSEVDYITKENYCKDCSKRFYKFTCEFINHNSSALDLLAELSLKKRTLRRHKDMYVSAIKDLLSFNQNMKDILSSNYYCSSHDFFTNKEKKYPILDYFFKDEYFSLFYQELLQKENKKSLKTLTYKQLEEFYNFLLRVNPNRMRSDIRDCALIVDAEFIEDYEQTYKTTIPVKFPRENEREGLSLQDYLDTLEYKDIKNYDLFDDSHVVFESIYSQTKAVLLNYIELNYCRSCTENFSYLDCIGESLYVCSSIATLIFENLGNGSCFEILHSDTDSFKKFKKTVADKLHDISCWKHEPFCYKWRGCSKYNERLQILPTILRNAEIPEWHYQFRKQIYFDDMICGHPMASHGWAREAMDDINECIDNLG